MYSIKTKYLWYSMFSPCCPSCLFECLGASSNAVEILPTTSSNTIASQPSGNHVAPGRYQRLDSAVDVVIADDAQPGISSHVGCHLPRTQFFGSFSLCPSVMFSSVCHVCVFRHEVLHSSSICSAIIRYLSPCFRLFSPCLFVALKPMTPSTVAVLPVPSAPSMFVSSPPCFRVSVMCLQCCWCLCFCFL